MFDVYLSLGSNVNPRQNLSEAMDELSEITSVGEISTVYLTEPVRMEKGAAEFHNFCARVETDLEPSGFKSKLSRIEREIGRKRTKTTGNLHESRKVDIDILIYSPSPEGFENHPQVYDEAFVVYPLSELINPAKYEELPDSVEEWRGDCNSETIIKTIDYHWPSKILN